MTVTLPDDWWTAPTERVVELCRTLPESHRERWARSVLEVLADDERVETIVHSGPAHGPNRVSKLRRVALHIMRDVCGLTIPQAADLLGLTVFSANRAAHLHRERHRYLLDPFRPSSEVGLCEGWLDPIARAMCEAFDEGIAG